MRNFWGCDSHSEGMFRGGMVMKCIICNEETQGSKEHIIPKALGNDKLITDRVCQACNNKLGSYVDNYFIDHPIIKIIRKDRNWLGESGAPIKIFPPSAEDKVSGKRFLFRDDTPVLPPEVTLKGNTMHIEASSIEEGMNIARKKLNRMDIPSEQIEEILKNCSSTEKQAINPEFSLPADIDLGRFGLAIMKIAYEYTHKCLGDSYLENKTAQTIRQELYRNIQCDSCSNITVDADFIKRCFVRINEEFICNINSCIEKLHASIRHLLILHGTPDGKLACDILLGMTSAISFSVFVAEKIPSNYPKEGMYITFILENNQVIYFPPEIHVD